MLCRDRSLTATGLSGGGAIPVKCRAWTCELCAPERRTKLIAQGISGNPKRFMTLTRRRGLDESPIQAAQQLAAAWRKLARMIRQEHEKPHKDRWKLEYSERLPTRQRRLEYIMRLDDKRHKPELAYLCVFEAHLSGWPHMHLIIRSRYIPQDWLSEKTEKLLQSKVVGISYVKHGYSGAAYVAKYVGESPHRFGTTKRYWMSSNYKLEKNTDVSRVFPKCWEWEMTDQTIPEIKQEWIRYNREPWQVRGGGIAWGWWIPEVEERAALRRAGGRLPPVGRPVVDDRHSGCGRSYGPARRR